MAGILVPPISDAGPNEYSAVPSGAHYLNIDDTSPNDDTDYLSPLSNGQREVFALDASDIPDDAIITAVTIHSAQKQTTAGSNTFHAGLKIGGTDYFQAEHVLEAGSAYEVFEDALIADPSDNMAWTKARVAAAFLIHEQVDMPVGLPRPRLTQCIVIATVSNRPEATPGDTGPDSSVADPGSPEATAAGQDPRATAIPVARTSTAAASGTPVSALTGPRPAAVLVVTQPTAWASNPGQPTATAAAVTPVATEADTGPTATPSAVLPATAEPA